MEVLSSSEGGLLSFSEGGLLSFSEGVLLNTRERGLLSTSEEGLIEPVQFAYTFLYKRVSALVSYLSGKDGAKLLRISM